MTRTVDERNQEDIRIMRQIEERARTVSTQLSKLEQRWYRHLAKLEKRGIITEYDFRDILA